MLDFIEWRREFRKLDKEIDEFKGTKKQRHEKFGERIDYLYNQKLQIGFSLLEKGKVFNA